MALNIKVTSRAADNAAESAALKDVSSGEATTDNVVAESDGSTPSVPKQRLGVFVNKPVKPKAPEEIPPKSGFFARRKATEVAEVAGERDSSKSLFGMAKEKKTKAAVEDIPAGDRKGKASSLGSLFDPGKKKPAEQPATGEPATKKSLFAAGKSKPKSVKAEKKAPAKAKGSSKELTILVELEDGRQVFWALSKGSVRQLEEGVFAGRTLSFSARDFRYGTDAALSMAAAQSLALSELGEDVRIVNATKQLRAVYAATTERTKSFGKAEVGPGLLVVEAASNATAESRDSDRILGIQLTGDDGSLNLVVLFHLAPNGEASAPQITVNPGDLSFVLAQFVSARRLDEESTRVVLLSNADLLDAASYFKAYPTQSLFFGLPATSVLHGAAVLSVVAAVAAGAYAGLGYNAQLTAESARARAQSERQQAQASTAALLDSSVVSFSRTQAMSLDSALGIANHLWLPGTTIVLDGNTDRYTYLVRMPMARTSNVAGRPSVLDRTTEDHVQTLVDLSAPENCTKSLINFSGALNAAQVTVECQNNPGPLAAYRVE